MFGSFIDTCLRVRTSTLFKHGNIDAQSFDVHDGLVY